MDKNLQKSARHRRSARAALESAIRQCRAAQSEVFSVCMANNTRRLMGTRLLNEMAELESSLDRAYDHACTRLHALPNAKLTDEPANNNKTQKGDA